ncbi:cytochrome P460 family protein [Humidesulfovibrio sp.]
MKKISSTMLSIFALCALLLPVGLLAAEMGKMQGGMDQMSGQAHGMMQKTDGMALMMHITKTDPYKKWDLMPGTTKMRQGSEPHGALQNVYVNKLAMKAFTEKAGALPDGAIIVKENYMTDGKLGAVTVMSKKKGYNPEAGDYLWLKYGADMKIQAEGKAAMCISCHTNAKGNDFVMLAPLKK